MSNGTWDNEWLIFSRKARRGVFVLLFLFVIVAVAPRIYRNYFLTESLDSEIKSLALSDVSKNEVDEKMSADQASNELNKSQNEEKSSFQYNIPEEAFNPNEYSFEEWQAIGFSDKQVQSILSFSEKAGGFKVKSDVKKLFVVDKELYTQLESKIDLPDSLQEVKEVYPIEIEETNEIVKININTATEEELNQIPGIGPFFAKQIIEIRESFGGIHDSRQLLSIYKMDEEKLSELETYFEINPEEISKLNINTSTKEELLKHRDISWDMANSIVYIREKRGEYKKIDDLLMSAFIDQDKLKVLKPYLTIE